MASQKKKISNVSNKAFSANLDNNIMANRLEEDKLYINMKEK